MSTKSLGQLTLDLVARIGGFTGPMDQASREAKRRSSEIERSMKSASNAIKGVVSALAVGATFNTIIKKTAEFENEQAQLVAVLRSTGEAAGYSKQQLNDMADSLSRTSIMSSGDINKAQTTLLAFTGIVGEEFPRALQAAIDMASRTGMSVVSASETIGRALDIPSKGLAALSRQGFKFSEEQKKLAEYLESTGRTAEAQALILQALEESYGGAGQAARDTLGGALAALGNAFDDLLTGNTGVHNATDSINDLTDTLSDPRIKEAFGTIVSGVLNITSAIAKALPHLVGFTTWAAEEIAASFGGAALGDIVRMEDELARLGRQFGDLENVQLSPQWINSITGVNDKLLEARDRQRLLTAEIEKFYNMPPPPKTAPAAASGPVIDEAALLAEAKAERERTKAREAAAKAAEAARKAAERAAEADRKAAAAAVQAIENEVAALQFKAATVSNTADEVTLLTLRNKGAGDSQIELARAALETVAAYEAQTEALRKAEAAQRDINRDALSIVDQLATEEERILASYDRRRDIILKNTAVTGEAQTELLRRLEEDRSEELLKINGTYWEKYLLAAEAGLQSFDELAGTTIENFSTRFGSAFESMIFDAQTLEETVLGLAESMARSIVAALGEMAAQWLAYQAVQMLVGRTTQASAASTMAANASAQSVMAGLNAFTSTAAIPITGPAMAPAAMAAATAATAPMAATVASLSMAGMAHDGIMSVPQTGTWLLEKGERVTTAETSAKLDRTLDDLRGGGRGSNTVIQNISVPDIGNRQTRTQLANDAARNQRIAQARFGR